MRRIPRQRRLGLHGSGCEGETRPQSQPRTMWPETPRIKTCRTVYANIKERTCVPFAAFILNTMPRTNSRDMNTPQWRDAAV